MAEDKKTRRKVAHVGVYETAEAKEYKKSFIDYLSQEVVKQNWNKIDNKYQHYYVDMDFYFMRTDQDASNYDKCLLDAITDSGLIWKDDNVVCNRVNKILYDKNNPRIEILIYPVEYIGIFDSKIKLDNFKKNNCSECNKKSCTKLNDVLIGRVIDGITDTYCSFIKRKK